MTSSTIQLSQLGSTFVSLNRQLLTAQTAEAWQPAIEAMAAFLDELDAHVLADAALIAENASESSRVFSLLLSLAAEGSQYRLEQFVAKDEAGKQHAAHIQNDYLPQTGKLRQRAVQLLKKYLENTVFTTLKADITHEIIPLLDTLDFEKDPDRFMPFRVAQIGNIYERLYAMRLRTVDPRLVGTRTRTGLLREIYDRKYLRFGTSGVRGRWEDDFTHKRARQVVQAICDFLNDRNVPDYVGRENLAGKRMVIGYDTRRNARLVAEWVAEICLANGFTVDFANRDVPTPALVFYETDHLPAEEVAGLIICTASHNPPEWQGIKFNPRLGYPCPTNVTDFLAFRINELQLLEENASAAPIEPARLSGRFSGFDPLDDYVAWIKQNGQGNARIPIDFDRIRRYFADKTVVIDEMHGAGRGYLTRLLGEAGVRYTVLHAQVDPDLPGLDYANPEEPFNEPLKQKVRAIGAHLGMGMDTDADRYGVIDQGGVYFRPNQILPMLVRYLGVERGLTGRVIATQTGSPLNEVLAGMIPNNDANKPAAGAIPAYVNHPFYKVRIGSKQGRALKHAFLVPVGIKYIEEIRRTDNAYNSLKVLPENWRDHILIGGEESSGLTTRGHVTDKDGPWACLLIMDMLAYFGTRVENPLHSLAEIWEETTQLEGCWKSYGTSQDASSHGGRSDVDATLEAKEAFINHFLDLPLHVKAEALNFAGLQIEYLGGIRYEVVEMQLRDAAGDNRHYLRMRASGTEPINRVYVESSVPETGILLMQTALQQLEVHTIDEIRKSHNPWRLADILSQTKLTGGVKQAVLATLQANNWQTAQILENLQRAMLILENRNRKVAQAWVNALKQA